MSILRKSGGDHDSLKALFKDGPKSGKNNPKLKPLYDRIQSRLSDGITYNLKNYKTYYACDLAWSRPLQSVSQTLLWSLVDKKADDKQVLSVIKDWGLSNMVKTDGTKKTLDLPTFFQIFIPLVRAYVVIRWSRITNDLKNFPLFKYEPQHQTADAKVRCEAITDRVQTISQTYDYFSVLKQVTFNMLHYGQAIQFPVESWHSEQQLIKKDGKEKEVCDREGIRFHIPHPTRVFIDQAHRPSTINTDSGVQYVGYWTIKRWREIKNKTDGGSGYWNLDRVSLGTTDFISAYPAFFNTVGAQCAINIPTCNNLGLPGPLDREKEIGFYSNALEDKGIVITEYFERCVPKDEKLFDYKFPIWMRYVVANDNTILFAEPLPYTPAIYYGYDANENQSVNSSLTLEVMPFEDHVGNLISQQILSIKQNLANLNLLDSDSLDIGKEDRAGFLSRLTNYGEKWFRELNFEWFSSRKSRTNQTDIRNAVQSFRFTPLPVDGIMATIRQLLDLLERVLVISAQELASPSSHEQTAEEIRKISGATSTRLEFTATPIHQGIVAWKKMLYQGLMAYGEEEFYASLTHPVEEKKLKDLGFTVENKWDAKSRRMLVKATKSAVALESFASTRDGEERINAAAQADAMSKVLGFVLGNERLLNSIGDQQALDLINEMLPLLAIPEDFKLRDVAKGVPPQQQLVQLLQALQEQILAKVGDGIKPVADAVVGVEHNLSAVAAQTQQNSEQLQQQAALTAKLAKLFELANAAPMMGAPGGPPPIDTGSVHPPDGSGAPLAPGMAAPAAMPPA